jgi:hypothetical protein
MKAILDLMLVKLSPATFGYRCFVYTSSALGHLAIGFDPLERQARVLTRLVNPHNIAKIVNTGYQDLADAAKPQLAACDGIDHGTTPERLKELQDEAHAFNNLLRVNETEGHGKKHAAQVADAEKVFYDLLPVTQTTADKSDEGSDEGRALHASKSLYEQATQLPVGERKALLKATLEENAAMASKDPLFPALTLSMYPDTFVKSIDVAYRGDVGMEFTLSYMGGQCTEFATPKPDDPPKVTAPFWSIILPSLNLRR